MKLNRADIQNITMNISKAAYIQLININIPGNRDIYLLNTLIEQTGELYKQLESGYAYITLEDYNSFKDNYALMLKTLKTLCYTFRKQTYYPDIKEQVSQLKRHIKMLDEIGYDIPTFNKDISPKGKERRDRDLAEMEG